MICIPITEDTTEKALLDIKQAQEIADCIELRLDCQKKIELEKLFSVKKKPFIVTLRSEDQGGQYKGSDENKAKILCKAIKLGAEHIDVEYNFSALEIIKKTAKEQNKKLIVSFHDFTKTSDNLLEIYRELEKLKPDIIKIVTRANSVNDNLKVLSLLNKKRDSRVSLICFCMGEYGEISRILTKAWGGFLTFGSLKESKESAPGQIPADILKDVYRVNELNRDTKIYGVIGNPVAKSKGYLIHNLAFKRLGLNSVYLRFLTDDLSRFIIPYKYLISGASITMPFKEEALGTVDEAEKTAKKIGALNTIVKKEKKLFGYNTDYLGALQALKSKSDLKGKKIVILGAGGAARAIAFGVVAEGADLTVLNRTIDKAKKLVLEVKEKTGKGVNFGGLDELGNYDILINTTSVGMYPDIKKSPIVKEKLLEGKIVFDAIYNPLETQLLKDARDKDCTIIPGIEMFLGQAEEQFKLWTGKESPKALMRKVLLESLNV